MTQANKAKVDKIVGKILIDIDDAVENRTTENYSEYVYRAAMAIRALEEAKEVSKPMMNWGKITTVGENGELNIYGSQEDK